MDLIPLALLFRARYGGIAQLARALGSYPSCPRFESRCRYHFPEGELSPSGKSNTPGNGALVKRLRHRPFTAVTRVRFPYASPLWRHSSAGRASASHAEGHRFEFCCLHQTHRLWSVGFLFVRRWIASNGSGHRFEFKLSPPNPSTSVGGFSFLFGGKQPSATEISG